MIIGPKSINCPDCGYGALQFLIGRGAFCLNCGRMRGRIKDPTNPWVTVNCDDTPTDQVEKMTVDTIKRHAVTQCLDGSLGPVCVTDTGGLSEKQIAEGIAP